MKTATKHYLCYHIIQQCYNQPLTEVHLRTLYDLADAICDREELGDESVDNVYGYLARACEDAGFDPLTFND